MEETCNNLIQALKAIYNPLHPHDQRQFAQQYCEDVKQKDPNCARYGFVLAQKEHEDVVRHFGFHLLEHVVKARWNVISEEEKQEFKRTTLNFIASGTKDILSEQTYIKEKLAAFVVEVAKREWPQRWSDLLPSLSQIAVMGTTQMELCLLILTDLVEDIRVFNSDLQEQRRKDLETAVNASLDIIIGLPRNLLTSQYPVYLTQKAKNDTNNVEIQKKLIVAALRALEGYVEWIPIKAISEGELMRIFAAFLKEEPFRMNACESLLLILSRKGRPEEKQEFLVLFNEIDTIESSIAPEKNEKDYLYHKRLAQILTLLGTTHFTVYVKDTLPPNYEKYLNLMLAFTEHPSLMICHFTIPYWTLLFREEHWSLCNQIGVISILPRLLKMASRNVVKPLEDGTFAKTIEFINLDFDSKDDYQQFFSLFRSNILGLVKPVTMLMPEAVLEHIGRSIEEILSTANVQPSLIKCLFEGALTLADTSLKSLPDDQLAIPTRLRSLVESLFNLVIKMDPSDPAIISDIIDSYESFAKYFHCNPAALQAVFPKLWSYLTFKKQPEETNYSLSAESLLVRRQAGHSMVHICKSMAAYLLPSLPDLYNMCMEKWKSGALTKAELTYLFESMAILSNEMKNYDNQRNFLEQLLSPLISEWTSIEVSTSIRDAVSLFRFLRVPPYLEASSAEESFYYRHQLTLLTQILHSVAKRTTVPSDELEKERGGFGPFISPDGIPFKARYPISKVYPRTLPNTFALIRTLHSLWNPEFRATLPANLQAIYSDEDVRDESVRSIKNALDNMRSSSYSIVAQACAHEDEFFSSTGIPNLAQTLFMFLFSYLEFMENRQLRAFLKTIVSSLLKHCPSVLFPKLLDPLLPGLCVLLFNKLNERWNAYAQRNQEKVDDATEDAEINEDNSLRDLTRDCVDMYKTLLDLVDSGSSETPKTEVPTPLCLHVLNCEAIANPVIYGLIGCLSWPDSSSRTKSLTVCNRAVAFLAQDSRYHELLGRDLLGTALRALARVSDESDVQNLIALIRNIYVHLGDHSVWPHQVIASTPGVNPSDFDALKVQLPAENERKQKQMFKQLFAAVIGSQSTVAKKTVTILSLPERLFVSKVTSDWQNTTNSLDLDSLWGSSDGRVDT